MSSWLGFRVKEEAHFDKLVDVGGGSYYIETLTDAIAHLNSGGTFRILFRYNPDAQTTPTATNASELRIASQGWQPGQLPGIHATITQQGGTIVHLKKLPGDL